MKLFTLLICVAIMAGCGPSDNMNSENLPDGWTAGAKVLYDKLYSEPPESSEPGRIQFIGMLDDFAGHHYYSIPADTPIADVVKVFQIGSHGAQSYNYDTEATIKLVSEKASKIAEIAPCRIIFADAAGLKLKFLRPIQDQDLDRIALLFPEDEGFQSGAERYINDQEPGRHLFQLVKDENLFHFWWD